MFPFRYSSIFRSRWMALFWAAGICWTAADVAKSPLAGGAEAVNAGDAADANSADPNAAATKAALAKLSG